MTITREEYLKAKQGLVQVVHAILETVEECGERGAPLGPMYAAFMATGMSYDMFMQIIGGLEDGRKIKVAAHVAYFVKRVED